MKVLDLAAGAGGLSLGFTQAGHDILAGVDVWDDAIETYDKNHESAQAIQRDMHETAPSEIPVAPEDVDAVIGGPPCQGFSLAGKREGDDSRNQLITRFLDYVTYFDSDVVVLENVVGILSMELPSYAGTVPEYIHDRLATNGYTSAHRALTATDYGIPQTRTRVFVIGVKTGNPTFPTPTTPDSTPAVGPVFDRDFTDLPNHTFTNHQQSTIEKIAATDNGDSVYDSYSEAWYRLEPDEPAITIKENHNAPFVHPYENRVGTPRECAAIQTFPDEYSFVGAKSSVLKQIGNAVPPTLAKHVAGEFD